MEGRQGGRRTSCATRPGEGPVRSHQVAGSSRPTILSKFSDKNRELGNADPSIILQRNGLDSKPRDAAARSVYIRRLLL